MGGGPGGAGVGGALSGGGDEAPKVQIFDLLHFAVEHRASDIHLSTGEAPAVRVHRR